MAAMFCQPASTCSFSKAPSGFPGRAQASRRQPMRLLSGGCASGTALLPAHGEVIARAAGILGRRGQNAGEGQEECPHLTRNSGDGPPCPGSPRAAKPLASGPPRSPRRRPSAARRETAEMRRNNRPCEGWRAAAAGRFARRLRGRGRQRGRRFSSGLTSLSSNQTQDTMPRNPPISQARGGSVSGTLIRGLRSGNPAGGWWRRSGIHAPSPGRSSAPRRATPPRSQPSTRRLRRPFGHRQNRTRSRS